MMLTNDEQWMNYDILKIKFDDFFYFFLYLYENIL